MQSGGGNRRVVMSLLQNFVLRNSIDRALFGTSATNSSSVTPPVAVNSVNRAFYRKSVTQQRKGMSTSPGDPPLDQESLSKLNELKQGLQLKNEYFEKYKDKFFKMESTSPRELLARLEQLDDQKKDQVTRMKNAEKVLKKPRTLNDVMHVDSLKNLERDDVIHLWQEFHRHKEGLLAAVMAGAIYDKMADLATKHKLFVMPLPRPDGYEFFFMQFEDNTFHFTPLIMYQTHKDSAPVALRLINYTDLKNTKDLVLLRGEYDSKIMRVEDAHFLAVQANFYFGETNASRLALLETFTNSPDSFKHTDLIDELKRIQETHAQLFEFEPANKAASG